MNVGQEMEKQGLRSTLESPRSFDQALPRSKDEFRPVGIDILESDIDLPSGRNLRAEARDAFARAKKVFGHLACFERNNFRPHLFHFTEEQVNRYESIMGSTAPSVWFIPEMIYVRDLVPLGLKGGWWQKERNFPHLPTISSYLDGIAHETEDRGGTWVIWQPQVLPLSGLATLAEQQKMLKRMSMESGLKVSEIGLGDIVEQAVLWMQAKNLGLIKKDFIALRSDTVLPESLLANSWTRYSETNLSLVLNSQGIEIADYGNRVEMYCFSISPFVF